MMFHLCTRTVLDLVVSSQVKSAVSKHCQSIYHDTLSSRRILHVTSIKFRDNFIPKYETRNGSQVSILDNSK